MELSQVRQALAQAAPPREGAAVLIALVPSDQGLSVVLEVRALSLAVQPGEVCLPGGQVEPGEEPLEAALRETCEELLVEPHQLEVVGSLGQMEGPGGQPLHVFVATLDGYQGSYSPDEVDHTFLLPLDLLVEQEPALYRVELVPQFPDDFPWDRIAQGRRYPWRTKTSDIPFYETTDPLLWGATARVLKHFGDLLRSQA